MRRGAKLTAEQIAVVKTLHKEEKSVRYIADAIGKSPTAVQNCIKRSATKSKPKELGRPSTIPFQFHRAVICCFARNPEKCATESTLHSRYQPKVGV